jgi:hypothetical protein
LNIIDSQNLGFLMINSITSQQYITDRDGQKTGVILSIDEYERLLDDLHDLAVVAERRSETPISLENMKKYLQEDTGGLDETMKPDFETMARAELRSYMRTHSDEEQAFHTYIDRFASTPTEIFNGGAEEVEIQMRRKFDELKSQQQEI